ncbi:UNVERIFIED_CONTAM: hypothetical protein GTU68_033083 [Idotea baltica]|nr:hypothetical protein [Idotea baltica]
MGGKIWVESDTGVGSSFHFTFKTEPGQESVIKTEGSFSKLSDDISNEKLGDLYPLRILAAEDNKVNQKVIHRILQKFGYEVDIAENGIEAVEQANKGIYDLVFMDMQMPKMDGLEATRKIIQMMGDDAPIIVAMTANAMEKDRIACLEAGMKGYISKPIKPKIIEKELIRWGTEKMSHV